MRLSFSPGMLKGYISVPSSGSLAKRALIMALLSNGISTISNVTLNEEINVTLKLIEDLGAKTQIVNENKERNIATIIINSTYPFNINNNIIDCEKYSFLLNLCVPLITISKDKFSLKQNDLIINQPFDNNYQLYFYNFKEEDKFNFDKIPFKMKGGMEYTTFYIRGDVEKNYLAGLFIALPLLNQNSKIIFTTALYEKVFLKETLQLMKNFNIRVDVNKEGEYLIYGKQRYVSSSVKIENDFTLASYFFSASSFGNKIVLKNMNKASLQRERKVISILEKAGCKVFFNKDKDMLIYSSKIDEFNFDANKSPQLLPSLAIAAAFSKGSCVFRRGTLFNENKKLFDEVKEMLLLLGADSFEFGDDLVIKGKDFLKGGCTIKSDDYRIILASIMASGKCEDRIIIDDITPLTSVYPSFIKDYQLLKDKERLK